jgi:hypothetical protein
MRLSAVVHHRRARVRIFERLPGARGARVLRTAVEVVVATVLQTAFRREVSTEVHRRNPMPLSQRDNRTTVSSIEHVSHNHQPATWIACNRGDGRFV